MAGSSRTDGARLLSAAVALVLVSAALGGIHGQGGFTTPALPHHHGRRASPPWSLSSSILAQVFRDAVQRGRPSRPGSTTTTLSVPRPREARSCSTSRPGGSANCASERSAGGPGSRGDAAAAAAAPGRPSGARSSHLLLGTSRHREHRPRAPHLFSVAPPWVSSHSELGLPPLGAPRGVAAP